MKKVFWIMIISQFSMLNYAQVIADHRVVDEFDNIPQEWIDVVKTKLVWVDGMSHGYGYFRGAELLEQMHSTFQVDIWYHTSPPAAQSDALRLGRQAFGRESHWTSQNGIDKFNDYVISQNMTGNPFDFIWFGWSYQGTWENGLGGGVDPVYDVRWAGSTQGGIDGNERWGLDSEDFDLTGNRVSMETYFDAFDQYNQYYNDQGSKTKYFLSNGVVDSNGGTELGFQRELKNQHIRDYFDNNGDTDTYFIDYANILVYNADGELHTESWNDDGTSRPHQQIHPDNLMDYDENFNIIPPESDEISDHIGEVGAVRLAKAMWWLLAKSCGWDSSNTVEDNKASNSDVSIYSDSSFIWISNNDRFINGQIGLYDLQGRLLELKAIEGNKSFFSLSSRTPGLYIVTISKENDRHTEKVVVHP